MTEVARAFFKPIAQCGDAKTKPNARHSGENRHILINTQLRFLVKGWDVEKMFRREEDLLILI